MEISENDLVYAAITHDALSPLPDKVLQYADRARWPEDPKTRVARGERAKRRTKPIITESHPILEDSVLMHMSGTRAEEHYFNVETGEGQLPDFIVEAMEQCVEFLGAFVSGHGGYDRAMRSMGTLAHRLIDLWNPLNLTDHPDVAAYRERFANDLSLHITELPFLFNYTGGREEHLNQALAETPYLHKTPTKIVAERVLSTYGATIMNGYLFGNGYPAIRRGVEQWYNTMVNDIALAWLYCCKEA